MSSKILKEDTEQFASHFELSSSLKGKSFLITGATGLIGSVMIKCLLELERQERLGLKIVAVVRNIDKAKKVLGGDFESVMIVQHPLNDINALKIGAIDYLVHLASPTASKYFVEHPVETLCTAIDGTMAALEYVKTNKVKAMVYASSLEVYGSNLSDEILNEEFQGYVNPIEVRSSYNVGKRASECLCHSYAEEYGVNVMIARMTQTFGAGVDYNDNRVFAQFARKVIEGEDIELHTAGKTCRMYCYTTDAISALLYVLLKGERGKAYNIANKESYISVYDMAQMVRDVFSPETSIKVEKKNDLGYAPETKLRLDTTRVESLGWMPRYGLVEMYARLLNDFRAIKEQYE